MHAPHGILSYVIWFLSITFIFLYFLHEVVYHFCRPERREREKESRVDILTISVKRTIFDVAPIFVGTTDLYGNLNTYKPYQELIL